VPNFLIRYGDTPFGEEVFDIPETQTETVVEPDGVTDDFRHMSRAQRAGLKQFMSSNLTVARAWVIKETFMDAVAVRQPTRAERALKEVLAPPSLRRRGRRAARRAAVDPLL